jgi:precorrin-6Y C5,15-methyltransferase (decarboxylating)
MKWLNVIGIGEDGLNGVSPAARTLIDTAELLIGGERHLAMVPEKPGQQRVVWPKPLLSALERIGEHKGRRVVVLASGDPMWCGIGATLTRHVSPEDMLILPHPGAFSLAAAQMLWPLGSVECITLHGRPLDQLGLYLYPNARLLILSENGETPAQVAAYLAKRGFGSAEVTVLEHLGGPQQAIRSGRADAWPHAHCADLNTIAVQLHDGPGISRLPGLDDDLYLHDGQITKREVRAVTLSRLAPFPGELLWDIGAGSGSIAIEWMRSHSRNRAIAIEQNDGRRAMMAQNAAALGVPGLDIRSGVAPAALHGLPAPDAIFIGGGILAEDMVLRCWDALKPGGRLVANVVTTEGEEVVSQARRAYGGDLVRLNVQRAQPVGRYHGWHGMMPVTQWSVIKE